MAGKVVLVGHSDGGSIALIHAGTAPVPGLRGVVPRWRRIRYTGFDVQGTPLDRVAEGFHARVVQHECDHLWGTLYPMRITDFSRFGFTEVLFPELAILAQVPQDDGA